MSGTAKVTDATKLIRQDINPTEFWDHDDNFKTYSFAEELLTHYDIRTTWSDDNIYWHNGRNYERFGEKRLRAEIRAILRDVSSREIVNEIIRNVKTLTRTHREDIFDLPSHYIVLNNGKLDIRHGTAGYTDEWNKPGTRTYLPLAYQEDEYPEQFNDFLFDILHPDDVSIMWELIGYTLLRDYPYQKAFMLLGDGANGKSTLLNTIAGFLGPDNVAAAELYDLATNRFATADLEGKLANIGPDISAKDLKQTGTFKALTGGDPVRAERKHQDPFQFYNHATLIFSANAAPRAEDDTYAYERRWIYFDFPNEFTGDDATPQAELLDTFEDEYPGILNLAAESFADLYERGGFEATMTMQEHDDVHERTTRPIVEYVKDHIHRADDAKLAIKTAYNDYEQWCAEENVQVQGRKTFERHVRNEYAPDTSRDPDDGRFKVWWDLELINGEAKGSEQARFT